MTQSDWFADAYPPEADDRAAFDSECNACGRLVLADDKNNCGCPLCGIPRRQENGTMA